MQSKWAEVQSVSWVSSTRRRRGTLSTKAATSGVVEAHAVIRKPPSQRRWIPSRDALAFGQEGIPGANTHDSAHEAPAAERWLGNIEADRHGMGPEIRSLRLTASLGLIPILKNRPEVLAELRKVRNLCTGRLAQSKSVVPLGVADDRYRTDVCQGNENAATYSRSGLAFLLPAQDVHASPPKGVDYEDEARRRKQETARTMAAAKEMRH
eukprot:jgi/Tetstr1/425097/TSEL_015561.t1